MDQKWFEMLEVRNMNFDKMVWIPIRAFQEIEKTGETGNLGFKEDFFGSGSIAFNVNDRNKVEKLKWDDIGLSNCFEGYVNEGRYIPANTFHYYGDEIEGEHLVLSQYFNSVDKPEWHLSQDFVVTLGLKREEDVWVRPSEEYIQVAKLTRDKDGCPCLLKVRAKHLKDYLCARKMVLYITSYRERIEIVKDIKHIPWENKSITEKKPHSKWEGGCYPIHEGGMLYGGGMAVLHASRTDVDPEDDVPTLGLPTDKNVESKSWTKNFKGQKLHRIAGKLWKNEWIEPASRSPIVRGDELDSDVFFIIDSEGKSETGEKLVNEGRWLWFSPEVINTILSKRGSSLIWYTKDTGSICCSPDHGIHFGINALGLVNVYAKDIGLLPEWQQRIWAGGNTNPEGKVSGELLDSQVRAIPAKTQSPENFLLSGLERLNKLVMKEYGFELIRSHPEIPELIKRAHRFRAIDQKGLFALAKEVARLTADSIDVKALQNFVVPPKGKDWGSLKTLENFLATLTTPSHAKLIAGPLFGIYDLRLADAHLPSEKINESYKLVGIDQKAPFIEQGFQLLSACVSSIYQICKLIEYSSIDEKIINEHGLN